MPPERRGQRGRETGWGEAERPGGAGGRRGPKYPGGGRGRFAGTAPIGAHRPLPLDARLSDPRGPAEVGFGVPREVKGLGLLKRLAKYVDLGSRGIRLTTQAYTQKNI